MSEFRSIPQRRAANHDPFWTANSATKQPYVNRATLEVNRAKMQELVRRARCGEVKPIVLPPGQFTIEETR